MKKNDKKKKMMKFIKFRIENNYTVTEILFITYISYYLFTKKEKLIIIDELLTSVLYCLV